MKTSTQKNAPIGGHSDDRLRQFFEPDSVVLMGAAERTLYTQFTVQNADQFRGSKLHLVNRKGVPVLGRPAATSCAAIGEKIDTAFIQVPAAYVMDSLEEAHEAGIRNAVILSSGFAEADDSGRVAQERLAARAEELGMMLLGPNHVGFVNLIAQKSVFALAAPKSGAGNLAVLSQSGAIATEIARFGDRQDIRLSHLVTLGNEASLTSADALQYAVECPETRAVLMFIEGIKHPDRFAAAARRAADLGKPVVVYKAGITEVAGKSAYAHTGAVVGDDKVISAMFDDLGVIRVKSIEDLVITGKFAAALSKTPFKGVGVISASGGSNDIIADTAEPAGVSLVEFSDQTKDAITDIVPDNFITAQNPFDLTGSSVRDVTLWGSVTGIIGRDPLVDLVLCVGGIIATPAPQPKDKIIADALNDLHCPYVYVSTLSQDISEVSAAAMNECGFKLYAAGAVPTLKALGAVSSWHRKHAKQSIADVQKT